jgi:pyruvate dehydrogenase E1 component alpha subunit
MPGANIDGQEVLAVYEAAKEAIDRARSGGGPTLIEADTYRFYNHTGRGERDPRPKDELERWRSRDPIDLFKRILEDRALLSGEGSQRIVDEVRREIEEAIQFAEASPYPDPADLLQDVYT